MERDSVVNLTKRDKLLLIDRYGNLMTVITIAKDRLLSDCGSREDVVAMQEAAHSLYDYVSNLIQNLDARVNG